MLSGLALERATSMPAFMFSGCSWARVSLRVADLTRDASGASMAVELDETQITIADTKGFRGVLIESETVDVEVVFGGGGFTPSAIRVDGRSVWTA